MVMLWFCSNALFRTKSEHDHSNCNTVYGVTFNENGHALILFEKGRLNFFAKITTNWSLIQIFFWFLVCFTYFLHFVWFTILVWFRMSSIRQTFSTLYYKGRIKWRIYHFTKREGLQNLYTREVSILDALPYIFVCY